MVISREEAQRIAEDRVRAYARDSGGDFTIVDALTLEREFGWVFFWTTKRFLETGNVWDSVMGAAPFFVLKNDGSVVVTGTGHPIEHYIENFERYGSIDEPSTEQRWEYETRKLISEGKKAEAIAFQRKECGLGLLDARRLVETLQAKMEQERRNE